MKILIVLAHPDPASFNHALAQNAIAALRDNGHSVIFHDLYAEDFDPRLPTEEIPRKAELPDTIVRHCEEIASVDGIIIVHPNWWGMPPALLTGWVDRVMRPGLAYEFIGGDNGEGVPAGLLRAKKAMVFNTSNTEKTREETAFGDPLERIWKDCIFGLCGVGETYRRTFRIIVTSTQEERRQWLRETREAVCGFFPPEA